MILSISNDTYSFDLCYEQSYNLKRIIIEQLLPNMHSIQIKIPTLLARVMEEQALTNQGVYS